MTQLLDLDNDCLLEVLNRLSPEQLFKMLQLNKRLNHLATEKIRTKFRAIAISESYDLFSDCLHLNAGFISRDQVLFLWPMFRYDFMYQPSKRKQFLNLLSKCCGVKSIDFNISELRGEVLLEVVKRCPELECIKFSKSNIKKGDWVGVLDQVGHQMVHLVKRRHSNETYDNHRESSELLEIIACKCLNITRIDWSINKPLDSDHLVAFNHLPNRCWITLDCYNMDDDNIVDNVDVIDELTIETLDWSLIDGRRFDRLSSIKLNDFENSKTGPILGVNFANLRMLGALKCHHFNKSFTNCLLASRFPHLEDFCFTVADCMKHDYQAMFRQFASVKTLTIDWHWPEEPQLVLQSALCLLTNLETICFIVDENVSLTHDILGKMYYCLKHFFQALDEISWLKKFTVEVSSNYDLRKSDHIVIDKVRRMKEKRFKIDLIIKDCQL